MNEEQERILSLYQREVDQLLSGIKINEDGEHLWDNYQKVTASLLRLQEIHNEIALLEIYQEDWPEIKKYRTLVVDPTIERLEKVGAYESRKITARQMEKDMEKY